MTWTCRINIRNYNGVVFAGKPMIQEMLDLSVKERIILKKYLREIDCSLFSEFSVSE